MKKQNIAEFKPAYPRANGGINRTRQVRPPVGTLRMIESPIRRQPSICSDKDVGEIP
jgi:hypothetical protein